MTEPASNPGRPLARRTLLSALALAPAATLAACTQWLSAPPDPTGGSSAPRRSASPAPPVPPATATAQPGPVQYGQLNSAATGLTHDWVICYPPGTGPGDKLPVVIALHGTGDAIGILEGLNYPSYLASAVANGVRPFAIAAIYGGVLFWQRSGSQDAGALVASDFLRVLKGQGLDTSKLALTGWSMGGWGALRLACDELHGKVQAVAALSTPCYAKLSDAPESGWMTEAEFETNNFFDRTERLTNLPVFLACGRSDAFYDGNLTFADRLANTAGALTPVASFGPGGHEHAYWKSVAPSQFRFLGQYL
jgi:enterochelin esterase-like enzyme